MSAKATVVDGPREPVGRRNVSRALVPLADLLGVDVDDVLDVRVGRTRVTAHLVTRSKGGRRVYHYATTTLSVPIVEPVEDEEDGDV
jgi:hypothetical protein